MALTGTDLLLVQRGETLHKTTVTAVLDTLTPTWISLCTKPLVSTEPISCTSPVLGSVYTHVLNGVNIYRLVPSVYVPSDDVFYNTFSGGVCSGKIVGRAD